MKIYTKRGDAGKTDLFGGERVTKSEIRVLAYGAVDAANSAIGFVASCERLEEQHRTELYRIMSDLFDAGAELATSQQQSAQELLKKHLVSGVKADRILQLEALIDELELELPPLKSFILPTGIEVAARFHLARVAVRQAEQRIIELTEATFHVRLEIIAYVNRLSDLMFVFARFYNMKQGDGDVLWQGKK